MSISMNTRFRPWFNATMKNGGPHCANLMNCTQVAKHREILSVEWSLHNVFYYVLQGHRIYPVIFNRTSSSLKKIIENERKRDLWLWIFIFSYGWHFLFLYFSMLVMPFPLHPWPIRPHATNSLTNRDASPLSYQWIVYVRLSTFVAFSNWIRWPLQPTLLHITRPHKKFTWKELRF